MNSGSQALVEYISNIPQYIELDPAYFARGMAALDVINLVLGVLKLLATYGAKAFAMVDAVKTMLTSVDEGEADDNGTVHIHECTADPEKAIKWAQTKAFMQEVGLAGDQPQVDQLEIFLPTSPPLACLPPPLCYTRRPHENQTVEFR